MSRHPSKPRYYRAFVVRFRVNRGHMVKNMPCKKWWARKWA